MEYQELVENIVDDETIKTIESVLSKSTGCLSFRINEVWNPPFLDEAKIYAKSIGCATPVFFKAHGIIGGAIAECGLKGGKIPFHIVVVSSDLIQELKEPCVKFLVGHLLAYGTPKILPIRKTFANSLGLNVICDRCGLDFCQDPSAAILVLSTLGYLGDRYSASINEPIDLRKALRSPRSEMLELRLEALLSELYHRMVVDGI